LAGCVLLLFHFICGVVYLIVKKKGRTLKEEEEGGEELP
jgi:hypothetical protein